MSCYQNNRLRYSFVFHPKFPSDSRLVILVACFFLDKLVVFTLLRNIPAPIEFLKNYILEYADPLFHNELTVKVSNVFLRLHRQGRLCHKHMPSSLRGTKVSSKSCPILFNGFGYPQDFAGSFEQIQLLADTHFAQLLRSWWYRHLLFARSCINHCQHGTDHQY